jgi:uncharacterized membrane protein
MSEPESLDTEETLARRIRRHGFDRLVMLCDGAFAIAVTLAAIDIHFPQDAATLAAAWQAVQMQVLSYLVSFAVIANFWFANRDLFARLHRVDGVLTLLVLGCLCTVSLIPAGTHMLYSDHRGAGAMQGYAVTMVAAGILNCGAWAYASHKGELMFAEVSRAYRWRRIVGTATVPTIFAILLFAPDIAGLRLALVAMIGLIVVRRGVIPRLFRGAV